MDYDRIYSLRNRHSVSSCAYWDCCNVSHRTNTASMNGLNKTYGVSLCSNIHWSTGGVECDTFGHEHNETKTQWSEYVKYNDANTSDAFEMLFWNVCDALFNQHNSVKWLECNAGKKRIELHQQKFCANNAKGGQHIDMDMNESRNSFYAEKKELAAIRSVLVEMVH